MFTIVKKIDWIVACFACALTTINDLHFKNPDWVIPVYWSNKAKISYLWISDKTTNISQILLYWYFTLICNFQTKHVFTTFPAIMITKWFFSFSHLFCVIDYKLTTSSNNKFDWCKLQEKAAKWKWNRQISFGSILKLCGNKIMNFGWNSYCIHLINP